MVDNPTKIYNDYIRANLPNSMSYDTGTDRYDINNHSFFKFKNSNWYFNYISKYGYSALSAYAVNNFEPALVFDFKGNYFRKSATDSTFGASITHAATTNATMVDSDGLLKWRPHNNLTKSNTFSTWNRSSVVVVDNAAVGPNGIANTASTVDFYTGSSHLYNLSTVSVKAGDKVTLAAWVRSDTITSITFAVNGRGQSSNNTPEANLAVTSTWALVSFEATVVTNDTGLYFIIGKVNPSSPASQIGDLELYGAHMFRSDLGGMVNNPDTTGSYVPTTTAEAYAPRRGHHHYNGSAWVNEGILHESEARTNLCNHSDTPANWLSNPSGSFTFTAAQAVGSDGTLSLTKVAIGNTSTTEHEIYTTHSSINPSLGMTLSAELKNGDQRYVMLRQYVNANDWFAVTFDLVTGVVTQESVGSGSVSIRSSGVIDLSNGLYRCWVSYIDISNTSSAGFPTIDAVTSGTPTLNSSGTESYSGTVGTHFYLGKMQLEQGATPSSYIPTLGASATRAAETLTVPAANLPYDNTNMSIQIDGKMTYADSDNVNEVQPYYWLLSGFEYIYARVNTSGTRTGQPSFLQRETTSGNDFVNGTSAAYTPDTNVPFNLAGRYGSTFINGAHEGTLLTANTTPTILPDLSATDLTLGYNFMGTIGQFRMWDEDLTGDGIVEAST